MKVLTAKVVEGRLDLPAGALRDGDTVTLLIGEPEEQGFHLSDAEQEELRAAIAEAQQDEGVDGWQLLYQLKP